MMSDLPGEMTKQILSAPPWIMRSTRYSLTAQGRSVTPSRLLPTGRSSWEKASGWMRLPRPAAGTMPHIALRSQGFGDGARGGPRRVERRLEIRGAPVGGVLGENPRVGGVGYGAQFGRAAVERGRD